MATWTGLSTAPPHIRLEAFFGIDVELQRRIGTFIVLWSMIETSAEHAVWALGDEKIAASRPSTDRMSISDLLKRLGALRASISNQALAKILDGLIATARHLAEIRHTVAHGRPAAPQGGASELQRNPSWFGEIRTRPATSLALSTEVLDRIAEIASTVFMGFARLTLIDPNDAGSHGPVLDLGEELNQCREDAARIRAAL